MHQTEAMKHTIIYVSMYVCMYVCMYASINCTNKDMLHKHTLYKILNLGNMRNK